MLKKNQVFWIMCAVLIFVVIVGASFIYFHKANAQVSENGPGQGEGVVVSGLLVDMPLEYLKAHSTLIVYGAMTDQADSFWIEPVFEGGKAIYTDFYLKVDRIIRGDAPASEAIAIRLPGGEIGDVREVWEEEPVFKSGEEYILFLYHPGVGGDYNTEGEYYYVLGAYQGAFMKANGDSFTSSSGETIELAAFEREMAAFNKEIPVDGDFFKNQLIDAWKTNVETGFSSQAEYDQRLESMSRYAMVVDESGS